MTDERLEELEQRCSDFGCHPVPSEVLELIAEVRRLKQARTPHINTGGPCPCCGIREGGRCTCGEAYRELMRLREHAEIDGALLLERRAEASENRKDAERYRWLRDAAPLSSGPGPCIAQACYRNGQLVGEDFLAGNEADAAIDTAMKD